MRFRSRIFSALIFTWLAAWAHAEPRATATLSQTTISPGDAISMTIEVSGVQQLNPPQSIEAEGLDIRYGGYQQSTQIVNGRVDRSVSLTYMVSATRAGVFTIPAVEVRTEAGVLKTEPVALKVEVRAPGTQPPAGGDDPAGRDDRDDHHAQARARVAQRHDERHARRRADIEAHTSPRLRSRLSPAD